MTNTILLKDAMERNGLELKDIADQLEISTDSLHRKIQNKKEFKGSEIGALVDILHLSSKEIKEIFFE